MSKRRLIAGLVLFALICLGLYWSLPKALKESRGAPVLVSTTQPQLDADGKWVVKEGETCSKIATFFKSPVDWTELRARNWVAIKQVAIEWDVDPETCPLDVGMRLNIPTNWVPGGIVIQNWAVPHGWEHWKRAVAGGIVAALVIGIVLGFWLCRKLRPRPMKIPME